MWGSVPLSPQSVRCPVVTASGTVQGQKGVRFLPDAKRGNNSAPVRQVGDERGAGAHFLTRKLTVKNRQQGTARICHFLALRGGNYNNSSGAGLFGLNVRNTRTLRNRDVGFRPALAPSRRKPGGYGFRDGTGAKGGCFLPGAKRGNNSAPVRQVGDERGTGAHFLTRKLAVYAVDGERPGYGAPGVARRLFRAWRRRGPFWPPPRVVSGFSRAVCGVPSRSRPKSSDARRSRLPGRYRGKRGLFPPRCKVGKQQRSRAASR